MKKLIAIMITAFISLPVFAELDPNAKYTNHDEVMRGTEFPVQDITVLKAFKLSSKYNPYSKDILEKAVLICKENDYYKAFKSAKRHPSNYTDLSEKRMSICSAFEVQLERMNR